MTAGSVPGTPQPSHRAHLGTAILSLVLLPVLFVLDRQLPMGIAVGMLYVVPVLLTLWSPPRLTLIVALIAAVLAIADVLLSAQGTVTWMAGVNRSFTLVAIASTAGLVYLRQRAEWAAARAQAGIEDKVEERTGHLTELNRRLEREAAERGRIEQALREGNERYRALVGTLQESERHLRRVIDLVPHMIFAKDLEGRFLLANGRAAQAYGISVEEMIGVPHSELHPDIKEVTQMLADDREVIESDAAKQIAEEDFTDVRGARRTLRTVKIPYTIPGGDRRAVLGIAIDITEEKANQRRQAASEQKYRAVLENAVDAIFLCGMDGRIQDANHRAAELLGYTREELLGMTAEDLHPPEEHERLHEVFRELANHGRTLIVHPVVRKSGQIIYCEVAASLIQVGDQRIAQGIFRDVSERERRSQARFDQEKRHRDTLVREVHHRIKNNLQGVVGLLRQHADAHPELYDVIGAAIGQVQSISVIYGLQGQGEHLHVRLCDMVGAIARNASTLTRADVALEVELAGPNSVCINKDEAVAIALIVNELIQNAVKHNAGADARKVSIRVLRSQAAAEVRVINPGRLAPDFDFARGQGRGTGLGLVRSLLPHTGATLNYEQVDGEVHAGLRLAPPVVTPDAPRVAST